MGKELPREEEVVELPVIEILGGTVNIKSKLKKRREEEMVHFMNLDEEKIQDRMKLDGENGIQLSRGSTNRIESWRDFQSADFILKI